LLFLNLILFSGQKISDDASSLLIEFNRAAILPLFLKQLKVSVLGRQKFSIY